MTDARDDQNIDFSGLESDLKQILMHTSFTTADAESILAYLTSEFITSNFLLGGVLCKSAEAWKNAPFGSYVSPASPNNRNICLIIPGAQPWDEVFDIMYYDYFSCLSLYLFMLNHHELGNARQIATGENLEWSHRPTQSI